MDPGPLIAPLPPGNICLPNPPPPLPPPCYLKFLPHPLTMLVCLRPPLKKGLFPGRNFGQSGGRKIVFFLFFFVSKMYFFAKMKKTKFPFGPNKLTQLLHRKQLFFKGGLIEDEHFPIISQWDSLHDLIVR